jgi:K+-transporting ATPase A subunit
MTLTGWIQIVALVAVLTALTPLLGGYMARVYQADRPALSPVFVPIERKVDRLLAGTEEQGCWAESGLSSQHLYAGQRFLHSSLTLRGAG